MATDNATTPVRRDSAVRTACRAIGMLAFAAVLVGAGVVVLPTAVPNLLRAIDRNPYAPLTVATWWMAATSASITGKRLLSAGHLGWANTTGAHIGGTVANRVIPAGVGASGAYLAALRRGGASGATATGTVALWAAAGGLAHACGLAFAVAWVHGGWSAVLAALLAVAAVIATVTALVRKVRRGRQATSRELPVQQHSDLLGGPLDRHPDRPLGRATRRPAARVAALAGEVFRTVRERPARATGALAAQGVAMVCLMIGFMSATAGFDVPLTATACMAAYLTGNALSAATPTPAGIGSAEAALVGSLVVAGVTVGQALPAVLLFRAVILLAPIAAAAILAAIWLVVGWATRGGHAGSPRAFELTQASAVVMRRPSADQR